VQIKSKIQFATLPSLTILCTLLLFISHSSYALATSSTGMYGCASRLMRLILCEPNVWPTCVVSLPRTRDVRLPCCNFLVYVMMNPKSQLHVNTIFIKCTTNTTITCSTKNTARTSLQKVTEADWLTNVRDVAAQKCPKLSRHSSCHAFYSVLEFTWA
jgi:hypothetical protein